MIFREVSARLFPWDFVDEKPDDILDTLERDTLTNSFYPVILMHDEKRPLSEFYYPRNPKRKVYWTEDSRAYWHFQARRPIAVRFQKLTASFSFRVGRVFVTTAGRRPKQRD